MKLTGDRWDGDPKIGTVWHRKGIAGHGSGFGRPAETRHVTERTLGGDVYFISGRFTIYAHVERCSLAQWNEWAEDAKDKSK